MSNSTKRDNPLYKVDDFEIVDDVSPKSALIVSSLAEEIRRASVDYGYNSVSELLSEIHLEISKRSV